VREKRPAHGVGRREKKREKSTGTALKKKNFPRTWGEKGKGVYAKPPQGGEREGGGENSYRARGSRLLKGGRLPSMEKSRRGEKTGPVITKREGTQASPPVRGPTGVPSKGRKKATQRKTASAEAEKRPTLLASEKGGVHRDILRAQTGEVTELRQSSEGKQPS